MVELPPNTIAKPEASIEGSGLGKKKKLLIFDDVSTDLLLTANHYEDLGYNVVTAAVMEDGMFVDADARLPDYLHKKYGTQYGIHRKEHLKTLLDTIQPDAVISDNQWSTKCELKNGADLVWEAKLTCPNIPYVVHSSGFKASGEVVQQDGYVTVSKSDDPVIVDTYLKEQFAAKVTGRTAGQ